MIYNPDKHRQSIRLKGYDYSRAGAYFVTICVQNRACLFGNIADGQIRLNDAGRMIQTVWTEMPEKYGIATEAFVVMPNHIHGIIVIGIVGAGPRACPNACACACPGAGQPQVAGLSLPDVVHRFKTMTTKRYADGVNKGAWTAFPGRLWQRNYYEHIIRNDESLNRIRAYIVDNPLQWALDRENPDSEGTVHEWPLPEDETWRI